eukprot:5660528-Alexandrium_andersonii.AAC.1
MSSATSSGGRLLLLPRDSAPRESPAQPGRVMGRPGGDVLARVPADDALVLHVARAVLSIELMED